MVGANHAGPEKASRPGRTHGAPRQLQVAHSRRHSPLRKHGGQKGEEAVGAQGRGADAKCQAHPPQESHSDRATSTTNQDGAKVTLGNSFGVKHPQQ